MSTDPASDLTTTPLWPDGYDRVVLETVDSTMNEAQRRAADLRGPCWIMSHQQTAGRGRRGREWVAPAGNFAATLIMRPEGTVSEAALRSFVAAVALHQALAAHASEDRLSLKWPNDVLLDGGKVAGILLESAGRGNITEWLAIGIGVNLVGAPPQDRVEADALRPVSVLGQGAVPPAPEDFLVTLAHHFSECEQAFADFGFAPIREKWLRHAARLGEEIRARTGQQDLHGTFQTVDATGNLVLETPRGPVSIAAADIYF